MIMINWIKQKCAPKRLVLVTATLWSKTTGNVVFCQPLSVPRGYEDVAFRDYQRRLNRDYGVSDAILVAGRMADEDGKDIISIRRCG